MATVEDRVTALEAELATVKRKLAGMSNPRAWFDEVAGSMDRWLEFDEVLRLGRELRDAAADSVED